MRASFGTCTATREAFFDEWENRGDEPRSVQPDRAGSGSRRVVAIAIDAAGIAAVVELRDRKRLSGLRKSHFVDEQGVGARARPVRLEYSAQCVTLGAGKPIRLELIDEHGAARARALLEREREHTVPRARIRRIGDREIFAVAADRNVPAEPRHGVLVLVPLLPRSEELATLGVRAVAL